MSGELTSSDGQNMIGVDFYKKAGQSVSDRNTTVNITDQYFSFTVGENIVFSQANYVVNTSNAINFKQIASFNQDNRNAISRWNYGNGTVYFFSDLDASYFNGDFISKIRDSTTSFITIADDTCKAINTSGLNIKALVNTERYLSYDSKVVKMAVYMWQ